MTRQKEAYLIVQKVTWITDPDMKLQFAHKSTLENSKAEKNLLTSLSITNIHVCMLWPRPYRAKL